MAASRPDDYREFLLRLIGARSASELQRLGSVAASADGERIAAELAPAWNASEVEVFDVRVNGARIDARFSASDGRAWLAVVWLADLPTPAARDVTLYERPRPFVGTAPGRVIVLNGPSSVGKSALMSAFADAGETPWACLDEPWFGTLPARFLAWPATAGPREEGFLAAIGAAARGGNQLIASAAGIGQRAFRAALQGVPTVYVGLDAPLDVLVRRQLTQLDKFGGLAEESVGIHDGWEYDLRIDTSSYSPGDAAGLLAAFPAGRES